jgi:hypothetical protein
MQEPEGDVTTINSTFDAIVVFCDGNADLGEIRFEAHGELFQ